MGTLEEAPQKGVTMLEGATHVWIGYLDNEVAAGRPLRRRMVVLFESL